MWAEALIAWSPTQKNNHQLPLTYAALQYNTPCLYLCKCSTRKIFTKSKGRCVHYIKIKRFTAMIVNFINQHLHHWHIYILSLSSGQIHSMFFWLLYIYIAWLKLYHIRHTEGGCHSLASIVWSFDEMAVAPWYILTTWYTTLTIIPCMAATGELVQSFANDLLHHGDEEVIRTNQSQKKANKLLCMYIWKGSDGTSHVLINGTI